MIDQTTLNFLAKLSLACVVVSLTLLKSVDCRALQSQQRQYSQTSAGSPSSNQVFQYQQQQEQTPFAQQAAASPSYQQYYDQQQQPQQSPQYQSFSNEIESSSSQKPNRRSILSSIMAPFYSMRDQGMSMLQASLQGCNPNTFSMWCRFWSMFIRRR